MNAASIILEQLREIDKRWRRLVKVPIDLGIGINTGTAQVGNTGTDRKFKYGPLGDTVNVSACQLGMVSLFFRGLPHCHQFVADVIDEQTLVMDDTIGECAHDVAEPANSIRRVKPLTNAAKPADIAEHYRDFRRHAFFEQFGMSNVMTCELGREELSELALSKPTLFGSRMLTRAKAKLPLFGMKRSGG